MSRTDAPEHWSDFPPPLSAEGRMCLAILQEVQGDGGLIRWQVHHDAQLWAETSVDRRSSLFQPDRSEPPPDWADSGLDAPALDAAERIRRLVRGPQPASGAEVCGWCLQLSRWARDTAPRTALCFAHVAALAAPTDAAAAVAAGLAATRLRLSAVADGWFLRALCVAGRTGRWCEYVRAKVELGRFAESREDWRQAANWFRGAARAAVRVGQRSAQAEAVHGLMRVHLACDLTALAQRAAEQAAELYPPGHSGRRALWSDVSRLRERLGDVAGAVGAVREALALDGSDDETARLKDRLRSLRSLSVTPPETNPRQEFAA